MWGHLAQQQSREMKSISKMEDDELLATYQNNCKEETRKKLCDDIKRELQRRLEEVQKVKQ